MRRPDEDPPGSGRAVRTLAVEGTGSHARDDTVAVEEPLEIRIVGRHGDELVRTSLAVTMRTPGHDAELTAGFLLSEGVLAGPEALREVRHCPGPDGVLQDNVIQVTLAPEVDFDPERFRRNVYTTSSCGVCGKASLEQVALICPAPPVGRFTLDPGTLHALPERLLAAQPVFRSTGGLHAAGLFDPDGRLLVLREDVGRHNAVDKVVGSRLLDDALPASDTVLLVSGRASFELVQKALAAGIPMLAAVGAPSSLAVDAARSQGLTLVGFLRDDRFNVYSGEERIAT